MRFSLRSNGEPRRDAVRAGHENLTMHPDSLNDMFQHDTWACSWEVLRIEIVGGRELIPGDGVS